MNCQCTRRTSYILFAALLFVLSFASSATNLQRPASLSGGVTDDFGQPIAAATIRIYSLDRILQTKSDAAGRFLLANAPAGTYDLEVSASGFKTKPVGEIKINPDSELHYDIALRVSTACEPIDSVSYESSIEMSDPVVVGSVLDAGTGKPLSRVEVRLFRINDNPTVHETVRLFHPNDKPTVHETNERGEFYFSLMSMLPGRYFIQTSRAEYNTETSQQFWVTREGRTVVRMRQGKLGTIFVCE